MKSFLKYWLPVLLWLGLIFIGSTDLLSAEHTSRVIGPILRWFNPDIPAETIARVQFFVRKTAHLSEYAILGMLLWRRFGNLRNRRKRFSFFFLSFCLFVRFFAPAMDFLQCSFRPGTLRPRI